MEGRCSPEDLLLSAVASCFTSTLQALSAFSNFHFTDLKVEVAGSIVKIRAGYTFREIVIRPKS
jgi:organic hydroperoxide reductase OsmC/OhrA